MARRQMNNKVKSFLSNDFINIFIRYLKESDKEKVYYENQIDKIRNRVKGYCHQVNFKNRIEKLNDVIDFEIAYYEYGNDTTPSGPFEYRGFSCRTNVGKILYCVSYFVEDVFGLTLKSEQKYQIINDIADIILDLKI